MNRREALQRVAMILGGSIVGANLFLEGCTRSATKTVEVLFEEKTINTIGDLADAILPPTSTPGAKEAGVGNFIPVFVRDCYTEKQQKAIVDGLATLDKTSKDLKGKDFASLTLDEKTEVAEKLYKEAEEYNGKRWERIKDEVEKNSTKQNELVKPEGDYEPEHWFHLFRQMTLTGFFNSELGLTKALRYVKIPGKYDGSYPYKKGDKAFA